MVLKELVEYPPSNNGLGGGGVIRWVVSSDSDDEPFKVFVRELTNPGPT